MRKAGRRRKQEGKGSKRRKKENRSGNYEHPDFFGQGQSKAAGEFSRKRPNTQKEGKKKGKEKKRKRKRQLRFQEDQHAEANTLVPLLEL